MINGVDLSDPASLGMYRMSIILDLPELLDQLCFAEQAQNLRGQRFDDFVKWVTGKVSIEGHGATDNALGLTTEQTRVFNPFAIKHQLMGPVDLWLPGDVLPKDSGVGEIKNYETFPELLSLVPDAYKARRSFTVGALFRGIAGRVDAALELADHNILLNDPTLPISERVYDIVAITGERAASKADLGGGAYKDYYADATGEEAHDLEMLGDEADMFLAQCRMKADIEAEPYEVVEDTRPPSERAVPPRPGMTPRSWIIKKYRGTLKGQPNKPITLTIVNGEAYPPSKDEMNRSAWAPKATAVLSDWLEYAHGDPSEISVFNISYAHKLRIAAALYREGKRLDSRLGSSIPVGNMPLRDTWYTVNKNNGFLNGGTLGWKEILPVIQNVNTVLGRELNDLTVD